MSNCNKLYAYTIYIFLPRTSNVLKFENSVTYRKVFSVFLFRFRFVIYLYFKKILVCEKIPSKLLCLSHLCRERNSKISHKTVYLTLMSISVISMVVHQMTCLSFLNVLVTELVKALLIQ